MQVQALQAALIDALRFGLGRAQALLQSAVDALDSAGLPAGAVITALDDPPGGYDPSTGLFTARAAALFGVPLADVRWIVAPDRWDDAITQVEDTHWVVEPVDGAGVVYERVNILSPWITHHPLVLENHLRVKITDTDQEARVDFRLHESLDGAFDRDEGFLIARALGPARTLVIVEKQLRVVGHPLVYTLLRFNPDGLSFMLSHWLQDAARNGRLPQPAGGGAGQSS